MTGEHGVLLERKRELELLAGVLARLRAGRGAVALLEGPAGIGKTVLMDAMLADAGDAGVEVLRAVGGELERDDPFGLLRQLFATPITAADLARLPLAARAAIGIAAEGAAPPGEDAARSAYHALFGMCAERAERRALLLAVDDAHYGDEESLRWLVFLARRLDRMPVALVVARRPREPQAGELVEHLATRPGAILVKPSPLSGDATAALVHRAMGRAGDPSFCAACHRITGGNPFLLGELLAELQASNIAPTAGAAEHALAVAPESVTRATLLRLARAPEEAVPLARALAVLEEAELPEVAALAGVAEAAAPAAVSALGAQGLLAPGRRLRFAHPLVRSSIYADIDERERAACHHVAAGLLAAAGASPERVAAHVLLSAPAADAASVEALRAAARRAYTSGAVDTALRYLQRALVEPPEGDTRAAVLMELGRAEVRATGSSSVVHLQEAVATMPDGEGRARALRELARAHIAGGQMRLATEAFARAIASAGGDRELALALEAELAATLANLTSAPDAAARLAAYRTLSGRTPAERAVLALLAFTAVQQNEPAAAGAELMKRALDSGDFVCEQTAGTIIFADGMIAVVLAEQDECALACLAEAESDARRLGWSIALAAVPFFQAWVLLRRGELTAAEERARASLAISDERGWQAFTPMATAVLCEVLLERGAAADAQELLARSGLDGEIPDSALFQMVLYARGRLRAARGQTDQALADLLLCGRRELALGGLTPAALAWRSHAALLHARSGDRASALRMAGEETALARRFGAPRALGVALTAQGTLEGDDGIATLEEAVAVLSCSTATVEHARALCALGAALRRGNRRRDARAPLREAVALADARGALPLCARAREELSAAGGRPRRTALEGVGALTPSEHRVAALAAEGLANREIAAQLFVTVRTVEFHLSRSYAKLGISSRDQLADALSAGRAGEPVERSLV